MTKFDMWSQKEVIKKLDGGLKWVLSKSVLSYVHKCEAVMFIFENVCF